MSTSPSTRFNVAAVLFLSVLIVLCGCTGHYVILWFFELIFAIPAWLFSESSLGGAFRNVSIRAFQARIDPFASFTGLFAGFGTAVLLIVGASLKRYLELLDATNPECTLVGSLLRLTPSQEPLEFSDDSSYYYFFSDEIRGENACALKIAEDKKLIIFSEELQFQSNRQIAEAGFRYAELLLTSKKNKVMLWFILCGLSLNPKVSLFVHKYSRFNVKPVRYLDTLLMLLLYFPRYISFFLLVSFQDIFANLYRLEMDEVISQDHECFLELRRILNGSMTPLETQITDPARCFDVMKITPDIWSLGQRWSLQPKERVDRITSLMKQTHPFLFTQWQNDGRSHDCTIPEDIQDSVKTIEEGTAFLLALVLSKKSEEREKQMKAVATRSSEELLQLVEKFEDAVGSVESDAFFDVLVYVLDLVKGLPDVARVDLRQCLLEMLTFASGTFSLMHLSILLVTERVLELEGTLEWVPATNQEQMKRCYTILLSGIAMAGASSFAEAHKAYTDANIYEDDDLTNSMSDSIDIDDVHRAMRSLMQSDEHFRTKIMKSFWRCASFDRVITSEEELLLRALAMALDVEFSDSI